MSFYRGFIAFLVALAPIAAGADVPLLSTSAVPPPPPPITIESCSILYLSGGLIPLSKQTAGVIVDFRNDGKLVAKEVRFDMNLDGRRDIEVDKGTFSPGVEIKHGFRDFGGNIQFIISRQPQPTCRVVGVTFADGTKWEPPAQAAPKLSQLAGNWTCQTAAGSAIDSTFAVDAAGNLSEHQTYTASNGSAGTWDQTFTYNADTKTWNVKNTGSNGWVFTGVSQGFDGDTIAFTGTQQMGATSAMTRESFEFDQPGRFDHVWETQKDSAWAPSSYAECRVAQ